MAEQTAQQEPSMEEILASIRRIISEDGDDEAPGEGAEDAVGPQAVEAPAEPELIDEEQAAEADAVAAEEPETDDTEFEPVAAEVEPDEPEPALEPEQTDEDVIELTQEVPAGPVAADPIVSDMTQAATSEHLNALSALVVRNYPGAENTLEGLVTDMLRPMLREWLDANLPTLVEQLVNREIARISGRDS